MNTATRGAMTPDAIDTMAAADNLAVTDVMASTTTMVDAVGTTQGPSYAVPGWIKDIVAGPLVSGQHNSGTDGNDTIYGTDRADYLLGLGGNDKLYGGAGNDRLSGGDGFDMLHGGAGADILDGGGALDTVSYAGSSAVTVSLAQGGLGGDAQGDSYIEIENVIGSNFDDTLIGDFGINTLNGGAGNDHLMGGEGEDTLIGGAGQDTLTGGDGADVFVFTQGSGVDHITDFWHGDKIDLTGFANPFGVGIFGVDNQLATGWIDPDGLHFAQRLDESDRVFFDGGSNTLYECDYRISGWDWTGSPEFTLYLGDAILTVESTDLNALHTNDFFIA